MKEYSLFNLVVYLHDSHSIPYYTKLIQSIKEKFSCHTICILPQDFFVKPNDCKIIQVNAANSDNLHLTLFSHLLPDIPIYLLWGQDLLDENSILTKLQHFSHRLIFDSDTSLDLISLSNYLKTIKEEHSIEIIDLNWLRISGWREAILKVFDTSLKVNQLKNSKKITIYYNCIEDGNATHSHRGGYYIQLWLSSRFSWHLESEEKKEDSYFYHYKECSVTLLPQKHPHLFAGGITRIDIVSENEQTIMHRTIDDFKKVRIEAFDKEKCQIPYSFYIPIYYEGPNFLSDILFSQTSEHYLQSLQSIPT